MSLIDQQMQDMQDDGLAENLDEMDMALDTVLDRASVATGKNKQQSLQRSFRLAADCDLVSEETRDHASKILTNWQGKSDLERLAFIMVYADLNELAKRLLVEQQA